MMIPLAAITDEFSPDNLDRALDAMSTLGMTGAELRVVGGRNIIEHANDELDRIRARVEDHGMTVLSIASPILKCELPDGPPLDSRVQHDVFGASFTIDDQPRLTRRAFEIAERTGARIIRVFSYWRTVEPARCFDRVVEALRGLAEQAAGRGLVIGLENEHACNVATAAEAARVLAAIDNPALQLIWDPANAFVMGELPFPDGYGKLPPDRIIHVHVKDCTVQDHQPTWGPVGEMAIDWKGQIAALTHDGYKGSLSLETHWTGPRGDKFEASVICGQNLRRLAS